MSASQIQLWLDRPTYEAAKERAGAEGTSVSAIVRALLAEYAADRLDVSRLVAVGRRPRPRDE